MWYNHIYNDTTINTTIQPYILRYNHIYNDTNIYTTIQPYIQWYNHIYYDTTIYTTIQPYIQWYNHIYYDTTIYTMIQPYILRYNHIYNDTTIYTMQSVSYSLLSRAFPKANYLVSVPLQQYMVSKAPPRSGGLCVFSWNFTLSNSLRQTIVSRPRSSYHYDFTCSCERSTHVADSRLAISWLCAVRWRYRLCLHCWPMHDSSEITFNTKNICWLIAVPSGKFVSVWVKTCGNRFFVSHWTHIYWKHNLITLCTTYHAANVTTHISKCKHQKKTSHFSTTLQMPHQKHQTANVTMHTSHFRHHTAYFTSRTSHFKHHKPNVIFQASHGIHHIENIKQQISNCIRHACK